MPILKRAEVVPPYQEKQYPGNPELARWLLNEKLPISTEDNVIELVRWFAGAMDSTTALQGNLIRGLWEGDLDKRFWNAESAVRRGLVDPIASTFGADVVQNGPSETLPVQLRSWLNAKKPLVNCQLPLVITMAVLERAQVEQVVSLGPLAAHPRLHITNGSESYCIDYGEGGGSVASESINSWVKRGEREGWVILSTVLGTMRFLDYNTAMQAVLSKMYKGKHGSAEQVKLMGLVNNLFDQMGKEFWGGSREGLLKYMDIVWGRNWEYLKKEDKLLQKKSE